MENPQRACSTPSGANGFLHNQGLIHNFAAASWLDDTCMKQIHTLLSIMVICDRVCGIVIHDILCIILQIHDYYDMVNVTMNAELVELKSPSVRMSLCVLQYVMFKWYIQSIGIQPRNRLTYRPQMLMVQRFLLSDQFGLRRSLGCLSHE